MNATDQEKMRQMLEALAPMVLGFAALLFSTIAVWRLHELRSKKHRVASGDAATPSFYDGLLAMGIPVGIFAVLVRASGLNRRQDFPQSHLIEAFIGAFLVYPVLFFAYVMVAHYVELPIEGGAFRAMPAAMLIVSIAGSYLVARFFVAR